MENLIKSNEMLLKCTVNAKEVTKKRFESVQSVIAHIIAEYKASDFIAAAKQNAISHFTKKILEDKECDAYTKRATKVAYSILSNDYKMRKEFLSLSQMEKLIEFRVDEVNNLFQYNNEIEYKLAAKTLIKQANVTKTVGVFSKTNARAYKNQKD
jgi:ribonucleotide reductase alpha subunit